MLNQMKASRFARLGMGVMFVLVMTSIAVAVYPQDGPLADDLPPGDPPGDRMGGGPPPDDSNGRPMKPGGGTGGPPGKPPGSGARTAAKQSGVFTVNGATEQTTGQTYKSASNDVSSVFVMNGGNLTLNQPKVIKSGNSSNEENSSFHGQNAGVLVARGSRVTIVGGSITANGLGANGLFATGEGAMASMTDGTIIADGNAAHGVMASAGGALALTNVTISTSSARSAAVATDRGSGTVYVSGGTYTTHGTTSPGIYSTGKITAQDATFTATASEAVVIEGRNSVMLENCKISGAEKCGAMIYQSFSGDAEGREGTFTMTGGTFLAAQGPLFFVSNTRGIIQLTNVALSADSGVLLSASASRWGHTGSNGGHAVLTADKQVLSGDISADQISSASIALHNKSTLTGVIRNASLSLDATSKWIVSADSTVKGLACDGGEAGIANIQSNGHKVWYDSSLAVNQWLGGKTIALTGGGTLAPSQRN